MDRQLRNFYERQIKEYALLKRQYARQQVIIEVLLTNKLETFGKEFIKDFIHNEKNEVDK
jgi:hypothetical protein